ncbi:hypothetical protein Tco_0553629 [Tanacetum coccineum]
MFKCVQPLAGKTFQEEFRSAGWCKENNDGQKTVAEYDSFILDLNMAVGFNSLVHSFRALSTLRCFGLRTASTAAKPYQGDSSELYLITNSIKTEKMGNRGIPTVAVAGQRHVKSQPHAHTSYS